MPLSLLSYQKQDALCSHLSPMSLPEFLLSYSAPTPSSCSSRKGVRLGGIPLDIISHILIKALAPILVLVGNATLEGIVWVRLDEQLAHGLQDGREFCGGLPLLWL